MRRLLWLPMGLAAALPAAATSSAGAATLPASASSPGSPGAAGTAGSPAPARSAPPAASPAATAPLGRLFLTPARRAALEQQRRAGTLAAAPAVAPAASLTLDGALRRSSGKTTVWINGRPQHDSVAAAGEAAAIPGRHANRARLQGGGDAPVELPVGATFHRASGVQADVIAPGALRIDAQRAKP